MPESITELYETWLPQLFEWAISDGVAVIALLIFARLALWLLKVVIRRVRKIQLDALHEVHDEDDEANEKRINTIWGIIHQGLRITLIVIFSLSILTHFGIEVGPLLASVGVVGLAVGFGSQELVRDVVTGLFNLIEDNIRVGDVVSINGVSGGVEKVELRTTELRGYDGTLHVFQNGKIDTLSNLTKDWSAAVFNIGVDYHSDLNQVIKVMNQVGENLQQHPDFEHKMQPLEIAGLNELGDSALIILGRIKTKPGSQWGVKRQYLKDLKEAFDREGIDIPFPHRTIYMANATTPSVN